MRARRAVDTEHITDPGMPPCLAVRCEEIAFDGTRFAWRPTTLKIRGFSGNLPITALINYPLSFHPDAEGVKEMLAVRGEKVLDYQELTYCEYTGIGIFMDEFYSPQKHIVSEPQS
jgi:hypothetical protein